MLAFFDTSVHVDMLAGDLSLDVIRERVSAGPIRMSPVVASELLRGAKRAALTRVEALVTGLQTIEPPSWRNAFLEVGRLLPRIFSDHEQVGLARLQNDALLAITARHTGATLVTRDRHFATIREHVPFRLLLLV